MTRHISPGNGPRTGAGAHGTGHHAGRGTHSAPMHEAGGGHRHTGGKQFAHQANIGTREPHRAQDDGPLYHNKK